LRASISAARKLCWELAGARNIEPLPTGDRQMEKRVAKARNPLQRTPFEVSLS
jgi:hypothetical protein